MLIQIALDHARIQLEIGDRPVTVAGAALGAVDVLVDVQHAAGEAPEDVHDPLQTLGMVGAPYQRRCSDCPGIDHRIERPVVALIENDRVESLPGGLDTDLAQYRVPAVILKRQPVDHRLGDRLDREQGVVIAHLVDKPIGGGEGDGELIGGNFGQLGNIVGKGAAGVWGMPPVQRIEVLPDRQVARGVRGGLAFQILHARFTWMPGFCA